MSETQEDDPLLKQFNYWLLGLFIMFAMFAGGGVVGATLAELSVPYGGGIGVFVGALLVFLFFSSQYYRS